MQLNIQTTKQPNNQIKLVGATKHLNNQLADKPHCHTLRTMTSVRLGLVLSCGGMFAYHIVREHQTSQDRLASQEQQACEKIDQMVGIPDSDRGLCLYKTQLYNVKKGQFDEVGVLVDTGSNIVMVDSAYCANKQPCKTLHVAFGQGQASYSQRGVAIIGGKQRIGYRAYSDDMSSKVYKLLLSAHAANQLGILRQPAIHPNTPTSELPELPVDKMQA